MKSKKEIALTVISVVLVLFVIIFSYYFILKEMNRDFEKYAFEECPKQDWEGTVRTNLTDWKGAVTGEAIIDCPKFEENKIIRNATT